MKNMLNTLRSSGLPKLTSFRVRVGLSVSNFAFASILQAQNLVPNWSFEDTAFCTTANNPILVAPPWFSANYATPDVFGMDPDQACEVYMDPNDVIGEHCFQAPFHGNRFAGAFFWKDGGPIKDYLEVELVSPLQAGHTYQISMEVSLPECYEYALDLFGAYFANDTVFDPTLPIPGVLPFGPQVQFHEPAFYTNVLDWMHVEDSFVANGGERFMVIGSFVDNAIADVLNVGGMAWTNGGYYYIDAVEVVDVTIVEAIRELHVQVVAGNQLMITWPEGGVILKVMIQDPMGRTVFEQVSQLPAHQLHVAFPRGSAAGIYMITAYSGNTLATAKWTRME